MARRFGIRGDWERVRPALPPTGKEASVALAELREADAPPDTASIYAALRQASGVPLVNLIHRHLATLDGVLPWVWAAIRPPLQDGTLAAARDRLAAAVPLPALSPLSDAAWGAAGLSAADRAAIAGLVEVYNRGNLTNLILLTALHRVLEGMALEGRVLAATMPDPGLPPATAVPPPEMLPAPPSLPRPEELAPATMTLIAGLVARHDNHGVVPSLYLHLGHWPGLLAALPHWAGSLLDPVTLSGLRTTVVHLAKCEADRLLPALAIKGPVPFGNGPATLAAIGTFTREVIPSMVPVGLGLRRLLAQP